MIYRVIVKTTGSLQPGYGSTFWNKDVVYCGTELEEARVAYLREEAMDYGGGYGNRCRETVIEQFESDPDEIDDTTAAEVDVAADE